ncbi:MAG: fumarylacetoacetate hydrolase family protein [Alicyclobacillus sp.]|nr:fumarylacetoacetate hydrolase family protein [Alicyclobacillus sp.]
MGIHVLRYQHNAGAHWGVIAEDGFVHEIEGAHASLGSLLTGGRAAVRRAAEAAAGGRNAGAVRLEAVRVLSPVTRPARIVCQGANYASHRQEAGMQPQRPDFNLIFSKSDTSLCGPTDDIVRPKGVQLLDYEIEVGLVMGRPITAPVQVTPENFTEFVAGLVICNDVSARDVQLAQGQWFKGKSYRTFCPAGPFLYLLDPDEADVVHHLELTLTVNGTVRQSANTEQLLFKPEETLTELTEIQDFSPGDLVLTGTPGGVALNLNPDEMAAMSNPSLPGREKVARLLQSQGGRDAYLRDGDVVVATVRSADGTVDLGTQRNRIVAG